MIFLPQHHENSLFTFSGRIRGSWNSSLALQAPEALRLSPLVCGPASPETPDYSLINPVASQSHHPRAGPARCHSPPFPAPPRHFPFPAHHSSSLLIISLPPIISPLLPFISSYSLSPHTTLLQIEREESTGAKHCSLQRFPQS